MEELYTQLFGELPTMVKPLSGAGSNRRYFRIYAKDGSSVIGVEGMDRKENHAFIAIATQMRKKGIRVPEILAVSSDEMTYLQEDLGDTSLFDLIKEGRGVLKEGRGAKGNGCGDSNEEGWNTQLVALLHQVMKDLPRLQFETAEGFDFSNCAREQEFTAMNILWDLNYFKYCFLKLTGIQFDEILLEEEFQKLETALLCESTPLTSHTYNSFLYRDFQSRNIMVKEGKPYYIDFQSGFRGPFYYDVASFLWQARAGYPDELRESLLETYLASLTHYYIIEKAEFLRNLRHFVFFRLLQVLGAYGFRGLYEKKVMFIEPILQAIHSALAFQEYPYLHSLLEKAAALPQFLPQPTEGPLTVRITSFSYKKGIPEDYSGNGGGFVFDCRAPHNPGRYPEYKHLTGLDQPVIDFLEAEPSMPNFVSHVCALVDPAVETYLRRGFTSLMVNFGCTGGQHRSVYAAQHLADHLAAKFPQARILLQHREQGIFREYNF